MNESQNTGATQENENKEIKSIENLLKECRGLQNEHGDDVQLYFRGESSDSWDLRPSVMRCSEEDKDKFPFRAWEGEMLNELMSRQPEAFSGLTSAFSQWVLAQHYGLKTRLLDITRNRDIEDGRLHVFSVWRDMIKSFNSDTVSIIANFAKLRHAEQNLLLSKTGEDSDEGEDLDLKKERDEALGRLYHFIRQEKPYFLENIDLRDLFRVFVVEPQQSFERIRMQSGAFLISVFHERFERNEILNRNADIPVYDYYTLKVPYKSKQDIIEELRLLNITRESLFPGLDEAAKAVTQRYSEE
ncbi:MAG: FRG domain-containing protein [Candidatus Latescibacteria bacterium]|nr:FRG domain-containing protein [Candidatus Latescibacterota bacterium]